MIEICMINAIKQITLFEKRIIDKSTHCKHTLTIFLYHYYIKGYDFASSKGNNMYLGESLLVISEKTK